MSGCYLSSPTAHKCYSGRSHTDWPLTHGVIAGGGIQITAGRLQFAPEVCYAYWNRQNISGGFPDGPSYGSTQNQLDVLLGISLRLAGRAAK